jgi:hypothetical protein
MALDLCCPNYRPSERHPTPQATICTRARRRDRAEAQRRSRRGILADRLEQGITGS